MKKSILLTIVILFSIGISAQSARFGIKGGVNMSTISVESDNALNIDKNKMLPSFNVGIFADIPLGGNVFSFQPSLTLTGKGAKSELVKINDDNVTLKYKPFYVDLQTNIVFGIPIGGDIKILLGAGPYVGVGVFGKTSIEGKLFGVDIKKDYDIKFTSNETNVSETDLSGFANMKRFDVGGNALAGIEFGRFVILANYEHGLVNIQPGTADNKDDFGKNRSFNVSLGIFF